MSNSSLASPLRGLCPPPFYDAAMFGLDGFVAGRFCAPVPQIQKGLQCCLPCPVTDFLYPPEFKTWYRVAEALNVAGLILLVFLLISFLCLPPEKTRRHYLSYCLIVAAIMMALGFVIPFGARPEQCYDEITPNDMFSSLTCAFSGAFLIAGGLSMAVWIFIRALSMHLQICWDVMPGKQFFYWSQGLGWSVAAAFFCATISVTGVSFRFGDVCHVNSAESMKDFWGPLLAIAGAAMIVQLATFAYCIKVYIKNMWSDDKTETQSSAGLPSYTTSVRARSARAVYRRVRKVVWLQWRGITIVVFILVDVIFFSVVFIWLNSVETSATDDISKAMPFLLCLMKNPLKPDPCHGLGQELFVNQSTVIAILIMLSLAGIQCFILLFRFSMFKAWWTLLQSRFSSKREFVSLDAKQYPADTHNYELNKFAQSPLKAPESALTSPDGDYNPYRRSLTGTPDYFGKEVQRDYKSPTLSFSTPRAPSQAAMHVDWDPRATHARGGLGLHPIDDDSDDGMKNKL
ncbi:hypothetical protein BU24DRAFT_231932 [Aaosphaeria arxii CBS 175.79]|uniref:G-protein coupled receptors family 2 profile 2 domain-containing protein n=1 Tax=Aaosphaeria arxii CBS 175.79 TaxID=1450172 RepID=A0A6A5XJY7_9PLEO|nr:uncharacterized protein BU24DRAFT_231932 [Aaosphaeria arxii CBS 175.79]KAF2013196.1 hypothetical protein BU24DRAFT_231932 [Aaosphaeria arxii CBS 175.79]